MTVLELKEKLNKLEDQSMQARFAFVDSENSDGEMFTYPINDVEEIGVRQNSSKTRFALITTNDKCVEDV